MKKIKQTLYNVEADDYPDLRQQMVEELVDAELHDAPMESLMAMLEELVTEMYQKMDDDSLQSHHDVIFGED
jgi:hypothetical protein